MISLCMIVKNEEDTLERCLNGAKKIADEIIIVDTGSTDLTVEIAKKYTDKIYYFQWINDFSAARNFSLSKASGDWIFILDADDDISPKYANEIKELTKDSSVDVYFFNTLNVLDSTNKDNIVVNQNPRLFQNKPGYVYEGEVHNQLISVIERVNPNMVIKYIPIDIYHYGYTKDVVIKKDKRTRNMTILQKQLSKNPEDPFIHFNLGNEYFALNDNTEAINHYLKTYNTVEPNIAYYTKLVIRLIICSMELKLYDDAFIYASEALKYYPALADIYYLRGSMYNTLGRPTAAVRDLEKAVELGEPPQHLIYFKGSGTYRSLECLYNIYFDFEDYEKCLDCGMKLLNYPDKVNIEFMKILIHCMYKLKIPCQNALKFILDNSKIDGFIHVSNILILEKDYSTALDYVNNGLIYTKSLDIEESLKNDLINTLQYYKGVCEFNLKKYKESINALLNIDSEKVLYYNLPHVFLSGILTQDEAAIKFSISNNDCASKICKALYDILNNNTPEIIDCDKKDYILYKDIIFSILKMLLNIEETEKFEKALKLFELINYNDSCLELSKLYYEYGKYEQSKKELTRSIIINHVLDKAGAKILYTLL